MWDWNFLGVKRVRVYCNYTKVTYSMKLGLLSYPSHSFFLTKEPHGPVTIFSKDLLIARDTLDVLENCANKGAYGNRYL